MRTFRLLAAVCLGLGASALRAQNPPAASPVQQDNPFPGDASSSPQTPASGKSPDAKPDSTAAKPKAGSDNPFPGEDTDAPILPADSAPIPGPGDGAAPDSSRAARRDADLDGDPVRSPDAPTGGVDDGFSSSRAGLTQMPVENDSDGKPGKSIKNKTREQVIQEDVDVGGYYLERKNWKAAQSRYAAAFALDAENPDAVLGMAEAERHLGLFPQAVEHYKLFLSYDPDGPHSRAARKGLEESEAARPSGSRADGRAGADGVQPK